MANKHRFDKASRSILSYVEATNHDIFYAFCTLITVFEHENPILFVNKYNCICNKSITLETNVCNSIYIEYNVTS